MGMTDDRSSIVVPFMASRSGSRSPGGSGEKALCCLSREQA